MRTHVQLLAVLATLLATVDERGRPSLVPSSAQGAEARNEANPTLTCHAVDPVELDHIGHGAAPPPRHTLPAPFKKLLGGWAFVEMPAGLWTSDGSYDLVIHFHGGAQIVEPQFVESRLNAVLVTVNLGIGSRAYSDRFQGEHALDQALAEIDSVVRAHGPCATQRCTARLGRLALSSWSAGYGALSHILSFEHNRKRVDALLMADGLHGGFVDAAARRVAPIVMAPFMAYARDAIADGRLMRLTHSQVDTLDYASTTETAAYLVDELGLRSTRPPAAPDGMEALSLHERGSMQVAGFAGNDAPAHAAHVRHVGELMFAPLARRWNPPHA
jgi:hypothetical protein